jgi:CubicO group peptidase (beta-lactamase class C family)
MKRAILIFSVLIIFCASCNVNTSGQYTYQQPEQVNDDIKTGTLQDANIDGRYLETAVKRIQNGKHKEVHSMLLYKNDKLVFEEYFEGYKFKWDSRRYRGDQVKWNKNMGHQIMSCTKSFTSACIGIAIDKGYIYNINQSIFDYLPNHQHLKSNNRNYITIEHLLTMTSGLAWDEWSSSHGANSSNDIDRLYFVEDQISNVLERPWWAEPGTFFTYNGGGMVILGEILKNATGMNIDEFSMKYLFEPLNIDSTQWTRYENGIIESAGSLKLTPRDMLKLGVTYLNDGVWNDKRILPSGWIEKSSKPYNNNLGINIPIEDSGENGYAYSWWTSELAHKGQTIKMFRAGGWGGQAIMVFPELDMVVVFTGGNYAKNSSLFKIIKQYVLPAVLGS